jgi:transcriptional regulator with XRE-family HTH domain
MKAPKTPSIRDILRAARQDIRFTQDDFAAELGVSRRTLSRWEMGVTVPKPDELPWIAKTFLRFDRVVGERVTAQLGVTFRPTPLVAQLNAGLVAAAAPLGVSEDALRRAVRKLVQQWRTSNATIEEIGLWLGA